MGAWRHRRQHRQRWLGLLTVGIGAIALAGCSEPEPVLFSHDARLSGEEFAEKPNSRRAIETIVDEMFGPSPALLKVPEGTGLPRGGRRLAGLVREPGSDQVVPVTYRPPGAEQPVRLEGGQALYHRHCLHCHGVSGDGQGPTAPFLYPRPRDYRRGLYKFTSTDYGKKPTRDDLRRTISNGIDGTSMPAFRAQLEPIEIEQLIDYVIFLSLRGEVERALIEEASFFADEDLAGEEGMEELRLIAEDLAQGVIFPNWRDAMDPGAVVQPLSPRVASTPESIARGRDLFLGTSADVKLECVGCHGASGKGDGNSWIDPETFNRYVFLENHDPTDRGALEKLREIAEQRQRRWGDDWGDPLRPADLNRGVYKGGRRPIDLYWRIATGITGTPMPAHVTTLRDPDDLWHLVNFVLALPQQPELLRPDRARRPTGSAAAATAAAGPGSGATAGSAATASR
ncbi:c-type cytochrome [Tautonia sociabilis]|nr:cytochrome c [Tautonia sociabilis]